MGTTNKIPAIEEHIVGRCRKTVEGFVNIAVSVRPSVFPSEDWELWNGFSLSYTGEIYQNVFSHLNGY
jgi:hypothetical protein